MSFRKTCVLFFIGLLLSAGAFAQNFDINLLHAINSHGSATGDKVFKFISNSATPVGIAAPVGMFAIALATHDKQLQRKTYVSLVSLAFYETVTFGVKKLVRRPRPYETYPDLIVKKSEGGSFSFPSGHTSFAFGTATSLSLAFPKWYVIAPSFLFAGAVGYSRMYLGVHYPSDVLGGMVVGIGCSLLVFEADKWINKKNK